MTKLTKRPLKKKQASKTRPVKTLSVAGVADSLRKHRGCQADVARAFKVTRQAVNKYINEHPELREVEQECKEVFVDEVEQALFENAESGNVAAQIFILKTKGKKRGWIEREDGAISLSRLAQVMEQLGGAVVAAVTEVITDESHRTKLFEAIESRWNAIKLEPDSPRAKRVSAGN